MRAFSETFYVDESVSTDPILERQKRSDALESMTMLPIDNAVHLRYSDHRNSHSTFDKNKYTVTHPSMSTRQVRKRLHEESNEQKKKIVGATMASRKMLVNRPYTNADITSGIPHKISLPELPTNLRCHRTRYFPDYTLEPELRHVHDRKMDKNTPVPFTSTPAPVSVSFLEHDGSFTTLAQAQQIRDATRDDWINHPVTRYRTDGRNPLMVNQFENTPIVKPVPHLLSVNRRVAEVNYSTSASSPWLH